MGTMTVEGGNEESTAVLRSGVSCIRVTQLAAIMTPLLAFQPSLYLLSFENCMFSPTDSPKLIELPFILDWQ